MTTRNMLSVVALGAALAAGCSDPSETIAPNTASDPEPRLNQMGTNVVTGVMTNGQPADISSQVKGTTEHDKILAQRILVALSTSTLGTQGRIPEEWLDQNLRVSVDRGVVTLEGEVRTEDEKRHLAGRIKPLDGVKEVRNQLTINPDTPTDSPAEVTNRRDDQDPLE